PTRLERNPSSKTSYKRWVEPVFALRLTATSSTPSTQRLIMNNPNLLIPSVAEDIATSQEQETNTSRRSAIKQLALLCGLALSANSLSALAESVLAPTDFTRSKKTLLNRDQLALVRELGEIIIPPPIPPVQLPPACTILSTTL